MISYADFEFAIERWKSRAAGVPQPVTPVASGTVAAEVPVATVPEDSADFAESQSGYVSSESGSVVSGSILANDSLIETPNSDSQ